MKEEMAMAKEAVMLSRRGRPCSRNFLIFSSSVISRNIRKDSAGAGLVVSVLVVVVVVAAAVTSFVTTFARSA